MSHPTPQPLSPERIEEIRTHADICQDWIEGQRWPTDEMNLAAVNAVPDLLAELDRRHDFYLRRDAELCEAFDDYQGKVRQVLQGLLTTLEPPADWMDKWCKGYAAASQSYSKRIRTAAQTLGLTLD